jgi:hypothetical protein
MLFTHIDQEDDVGKALLINRGVLDAVAGLYVFFKKNRSTDKSLEYYSDRSSFCLQGFLFYCLHPQYWLLQI